MTDSAPSTTPTVSVVQDYLADLARGDAAAGAARFADDLTYIAPGRNALAGVTHGQNAAGDWFARMQQLSGGTYGITDTVDWLASDTRALLLANEHATVAGRQHQWQRAVLFSVTDRRIRRVQLFEDDQYGYDDWLGTPTTATTAAVTTGQDGGGHHPQAGPPQMSGDLDDPRVRAVLSYQQQVASGDLDSARSIFWPDVTYTVPGRGLLAGTYRGPDEVMGYFGKLFALTDATYAISAMHWLTSPHRVALATVNAATRNGQSLTWDEVIVFTFVDGRKKSISHFSGDQYGVDALFAQ